MKEIKFYDFDLKLSAEERWGPIFDAHASYLSRLNKQLRSLIDQFGLATKIGKPVYNLTSSSKIMYYDEICYIAQRIGLDTYETLLMQLIYETSSACTATVLRVGDKEFFFRTMDWPMMFLKDITIGLNIRKGDKLIGKVTTWLGYVGYLTATRLTDSESLITNDYTVAINYRRTEEMSLVNICKNFFRTVNMKWPIGHLVRYIIDSNFEQDGALRSLQEAELISPCYITVYVPYRVTSIITRDCDRAVDTRTFDLIQTNCDWNKTEPNILWSLERRTAIAEVQRKLKDKSNMKSKEIIDMLLKEPILNEETIYVHYQYNDEFVTLV
jgi:hypothetical protein